MKDEQQSRVALVTGAHGTLGRAISASLEARGHSVVRVDLAGEDCVRFDVSSADGCAAMVAHAIDRFGRLDALILNAGNQHVAPLPEFPEDAWDRVNDLCVKGPFLAIRAAWPHLIARPGGRVVATASTSSFQAEPYKAAYVAAKHGLIGLMKVTALEGAPFGLTANSVAPTWMRSPMLEGQLREQMSLRNVSEQEVIDGFLNRQPVKRFVEPNEVAETIAFLASPQASAITGACIPVDLGTLAS